MVEQLSKDSKEKFQKYNKQTKEAGVKEVHYSIEFGAPKAIIAHQFPKKHQIDLVVLGATGLNAVERILIGSVTEYVTRTADCDVLVCRSNENLTK